MKRLYILLLLTVTIGFGESFKLNHHCVEQFKNDGNITAAVDGKTFDVRNANKYSAELKNISLDNAVFSAQKSDKLTQVTTDLKIYGLDFSDAQNNLYTESIQFHYAFGDGTTGEPVQAKVILNYEDQQYFNIASETNIQITKLEWSPDKSYFVMSADFDCLLRRWGMPANPKTALHLKGTMEDINVTVPSWIVLNNSMPVAQK